MASLLCWKITVKLDSVAIFFKNKEILWGVGNIYYQYIQSKNSKTSMEEMKNEENDKYIVNLYKQWVM